MFSKGKKPQISLKNLDVTDVYKTSKFEGFDHEARPRPFQTMFALSDLFAFLYSETIWIALTYYGINFNITSLRFIVTNHFLVTA